MNFKRIIYLLFILILSAPNNLLNAQNTRITGQVIDSKTKTPISFASVVFTELKGVGTTANVEGRFTLETDKKINHLDVSFIGYTTKRINLKGGAKQYIQVKMDAENETLQAATVTGDKQRYRNKNNPAVDLLRQIIAHKWDNRIQSKKYYQYQKYEKLELSLNNFRDTSQNLKGLLKKANFIFNYVDTSELTGKRVLPFFFRETLSDIYYRQLPPSTKEYIKAERNVDFHHFIDMTSVNTYINSIFSPIDLYDNDVMIMQVKMLSPLSPIAPNMFKYHIIDTLDVEGVNCIKLTFYPRNSADLAFSGDIYVLNDSSYVIKQIDLRTPKNSGINFVRNFQLRHVFNQINGTWCLTDDEMTVEFVTSEDDVNSMLGTRRVTQKSYVFDEEAPAELYKGVAKIIRLPESNTVNEEDWVNLRHQELTKREQGVFVMVDSLKKVPLFKHTLNALTMVFSGYSQVGKFDIGPVVSFLSFNPHEGTRLRFGGKTNAHFDPHFFAAAYLAYGTKDKIFKGNGTLMYSINKRKEHPWEFPMNLFSLSYQYDLKVPGQSFLYGSGDKLFLSFRRGPAQKMNLDKSISLQWMKEYLSGFSFRPSLKWLEQSPQGDLKYTDGFGVNYSKITTAEAGLGVRFAPNETFYQDQMNRFPIDHSRPIFGINQIFAFKSVFGGQYFLNRTELNFDKRFWIAGIGFAEMWFKAGKIWNKEVPFPLLIVPQANQNYAYQDEAYNLMNFLEFVNDQYISANFSYCFNGVLFNRIPLINKLKLREYITFKAMLGSLDKKNDPKHNPKLLAFPVNTFALESNRPYLEAGFALDNIFKVLRVDLIRRINYLDHPNIVEWGICFRLRPRF